MNLSELKPNVGARKPRKRIGRGPGSGTGKTSGGGHKGDKARGNTKPGFEGGQTPLHRRLPQVRGLAGKGGFNAPPKAGYAVVNLSQLERFENGATVTIETLIDAGLVGSVKDGVKILGNGELTKKLTVRVTQFSKSAEEKIAALGGTTEIV
jgi:large subunit ribosomal protein L15